MEQLTYRNFVKEIARDFSLSPDKENKLKMPADKKVVKNFVRGNAYRMRIFDGAEHPYMINNTVRNDEAFAKAVELRYFGEKGLTTILREAGIKLKSENCKISEGGWYSEGTKYFYKDYYVEV